MLETPANMKDFQNLAKNNALGQLVALESENDGVFNIVGINPHLGMAFILYDTELEEKRHWVGSRNLYQVAQKIGCCNLTIRGRERTAISNNQEESGLKLSNGTVISFQ